MEAWNGVLLDKKTSLEIAGLSIIKPKDCSFEDEEDREHAKESCTLIVRMKKKTSTVKT